MKVKVKRHRHRRRRHKHKHQNQQRHQWGQSPTCHISHSGASNAHGLKLPLVMGMFLDRYWEAFSAHERAVFVEENRQRDRCLTVHGTNLMIRKAWFLRIEYWAGIIGICAFFHQLFVTWIWPRFNTTI
ncbi:hypothetical protein F4810DRAFT_707424 [Camillea tinctor]|nr:hypothetical protein F4810DRAFT_707424 [Camillea tinctor]